MDNKEKIYNHPELEIVYIDLEQSILASSTENIGETLEELDW